MKFLKILILFPIILTTLSLLKKKRKKKNPKFRFQGAAGEVGAAIKKPFAIIGQKIEDQRNTVRQSLKKMKKEQIEGIKPIGNKRVLVLENLIEEEEDLNHELNIKNREKYFEIKEDINNLQLSLKQTDNQFNEKLEYVIKLVKFGNDLKEERDLKEEEDLENKILEEKQEEIDLKMENKQLEDLENESGLEEDGDFGEVQDIDREDKEELLDNEGDLK